MSETSSYEAWQGLKQREWESRCLNCGACCGALEDPCEHLHLKDDGKYECRVYPERFGAHKTVSGQACYCVPIRSKLGQSWPGDGRCGYK